MPVIAVGFAVAAIAVAVEVGTTLAIVAAVGATIAAVGAVTNNRTLMIAGGIIGAIGGIGALATSAGIIGADALSFGSNAAAGLASDASSVAGAAGGIDSEIAQWSSYGSALDAQGNTALGAASLSGAPTAQSDVIDMASGTMQPIEGSASPALAAADAPNVAPNVAVDNAAIPQGDNELTTPSDTVRFSQQPGNPANVTGSSTPAAPSVPDATATTNSILNPKDGGIPGSWDAAQRAASVTGSVKMPQPSSGIWDALKSVLDTKGGGTLLSGVLQAGSSFIGGATNGLTPAQIAALNAQAEANQAAANLSRTQQANMSQPLPVATRTPPVTGAPAGLINSPPRIPVTGAA